MNLKDNRMKELNKFQVKHVYEWMETWYQLKNSRIPERFKEVFSDRIVLKRETEKQKKEQALKGKLDTLKLIVENYLKIKDLSVKSKERDVSDARKIYCLLAKKMELSFSFKRIGLNIKRKHSTILIATKRAEILMESDVEFRKKYNLVYDSIDEETKKMFKSEEINVFDSKEIRDLQKEVIELKEYIMFLNEEKNIKLKLVLTDNELKYRQLSEKNKSNYDVRVGAILKMLNIVERKESSKFETITCEV